MLQRNLFTQRSLDAFHHGVGSDKHRIYFSSNFNLQKWSKFIAVRLLHRSSTHRMKLWCSPSIFHCQPKLNSELLDDVWPFARPPLPSTRCCLSSTLFAGLLPSQSIESSYTSSKFTVRVGCMDLPRYQKLNMMKLNLSLPFTSALPNAALKSYKIAFSPFSDTNNESMTI